MDRNNVKYNKLIRNEDYYVLKQKLEHITRPNQTILEHLFKNAIETTMPQEILKQHADRGVRE